MLDSGSAFFSEYRNLFLIGGVIIDVIFLLWMIVLTIFVVKTYRFSKVLFGDTTQEDLKVILKEHIGRIGTVHRQMVDLQKQVDTVVQKSNNHFAKVGLVRFNPYADTGGDQSFSLSLLDEKDDGVVISSLHGRQRTRIYVKPVKQANATDYELSEEEKESIRKAKALGNV